MLWTFLILLFVGSSFTRDAKWLFPKKQTITSYQQKKMLLTQLVPSSCVVVDSTLPSCRSLRKLKIDPAPTRRIESTPLPEMAGPRSFDLEAAETDQDPRSWGANWLWPHDVVTKTVLKYETVKHINPSAVVSIYFKGCQPTSLPFNLSPCKESSPTATETIQREIHYTNED